ncbi:U32 family peptidase [Synechococcus sp. CCY9202]|uniref:U32 family peptidase n=1 Tax=Synechococcus sp. CCY9202 TaxID=174698 RepID=UPI002B1EF84A|nr:U32 family peptidase [Synechococcus sp. CCY9202]MEA5422968.1 U32 family peptidase [Synechococcus sp. CCY9202]
MSNNPATAIQVPLTMPELLAPAGCWASLKAAAANGADAVYFGVEAFNARLRAENFSRQDLPELMDWLHRRGIRGFLTLNVLIFPDELEQAADLLLEADAAGVDAVIVQDVGLCRLARQVVPRLSLHGSTQMSITSAAGVAQAEALGCDRVVLARELSLRDLRRIDRQQRQRGMAMPLEVFVHGALCVAYSGQCLTSEALGQRSANRGECAQACRLPYQLIVDGVERDLGTQRYLLSPQDLAAWELLPQLVDTGVASLKIEGRLKDPTYVAAVTSAYRQSLDRLATATSPAQLVSESRSEVSADQPPEPSRRHELELSFSRGLSSGWLHGVDHRQLVHGRWSKKRGPQIGHYRGQEARGGWWLLDTITSLKPGDGLVFELAGSAPLVPPEEIGGRVMAVESRGEGRLALRLGPGRISAETLPPGSPCWLSSDPALEKRWRRLATADTPELARALHLRVRGALDQPLQLELLAVDGTGTLPEPPLQWYTDLPLQSARGPGLDRQRLEQQLGRLGGTGWRLGSLDVDLPAGLFLPVTELNRLRRGLVAALTPLLASGSSTSGKPWPLGALSTAPARTPAQAIQAWSAAELQQSSSTEPELVVLVRSLEQLQALQGLPVAQVIADLEQPADLREAVALGRGCWPGGIWLAGARITRPDEAWSLEPLWRARPDGFLVRNADQLERLTPLAPCIGDFSLNVANPLAAHWYLDHWGLQRVTASYDLALSKLQDLIRGCPAGRLEVTVHQHMPLFHMEHCLFCAFLSDGHDHTDCGRPCEQHEVRLRDRSGVEHPLRADLGCRNTLFNGKAQTAAEALPALLDSGVRHLRLELLEENAEATRRRVDLYRQALDGRLSGRDLWRNENLDSRLGVTRGTLRDRVSRQSRD